MDRFSEDDKIITATAADETKAEVFKKLALETDYFIQGRYIVDIVHPINIRHFV